MEKSWFLNAPNLAVFGKKTHFPDNKISDSCQKPLFAKTAVFSTPKMVCSYLFCQKDPLLQHPVFDVLRL